MSKRISLILFLTLTITSCATKSTPPPTEVPTHIVVDTATLEPTITPTPIPPTETPTETPTQTPSHTPTPTNTPSFLELYPEEGYGPFEFPPDINPLTGLQVENIAQLDRRPISIKVSNYPIGIRPQWGLSLADHVYEYYHEGGLTRFNAIFHSNHPDQVGPIRSARFTDEDIIQMYKAYFASAGADWRVRWRLANSNISNLLLMTATELPCPPTGQFPFCRVEQNSWNHMVTDTDALVQYFVDQGFMENIRRELDGLHFNTLLPPDGQPASSVVVRYSTGSYHKWEYDPISGKYFRYGDVQPDLGDGEVFQQSTDRLTGQPITADNVVVLIARHTYYSLTPEMVEINLSGFGKAYLFREGFVYLINWTRPTDLTNLSLTFDDGSRFPLKPGNVWFDVVGQSTLITEETPNWRFQFFTP